MTAATMVAIQNQDPMRLLVLYILAWRGRYQSIAQNSGKWEKQFGLAACDDCSLTPAKRQTDKTVNWNPSIHLSAISCSYHRNPFFQAFSVRALRKFSACFQQGKSHKNTRDRESMKRWVFAHVICLVHPFSVWAGISGRTLAENVCVLSHLPLKVLAVIPHSRE